MYLVEDETFRQALLFVLILALGLAIVKLPLNMAVALVAGGVATFLTLLRPLYGLYFLIFAIPFASIKEIQIGVATVGATEFLVALVVSAWLARMVTDRRVRIVPPPLLWSLLVFLALLTLTFAVTLSLQASVKEWLKWGEVLVVYLFVTNFVRRNQVPTVMALILVAGIAQALLGLYQSFARIGPEGFLFPVAGRLMMRAYGTFQQPNPYGGYLGLIMPLAYSLFVVNWSWRGEKWAFPLWLLGGLGLAVMGLAMLMTLSRGAWLGFIAAFVLMNVVRSRRALILFLILLILAVVGLLLGGVGLLPTVITQRFLDFLPYLGVVDIGRVEVTPENWAIIERMAHWIAGWRMFSDHPWLGVGVGNYAAVYPAYALPGWEDPLGHAHNYYLNVAAEAGLLGLMAYLIFVAACFWQAWRTLPLVRGLWQGTVVGIIGVLAALSTHNLFDNLYVHGMNIHVAILLGLIYVVATQPILKHQPMRSLCPD
ncbi:MAG: O-antigen ligase family protein [Anaerolineae bacterium]